MKQELANLAIKLNMEAQKRRHMEADHDRQNGKADRKDIQVSRLRASSMELNMHIMYLQSTLTREDNLKVEERSKVIAGTRYENQRRELDKSLKSKQDTLQARHRQGGCG